MSFFDPTMVNIPNPDGFEEYSIHTEVGEDDYPLIRHLENTKWVHFANGGDVIGGANGRISRLTRWYGLKISDVLNL